MRLLGFMNHEAKAYAGSPQLSFQSRHLVLRDEVEYDSMILLIDRA